MAYAYIDDFCPRDCGAYVLFAYPYLEGVRNISIGFPCFDPKDTVEPPPSIIGRVAHVILGASLILPIVNTIVFIVLRFFGTHSIFIDQPIPENVNHDDSPRIDELNSKRAKLMREIVSAQTLSKKLKSEGRLEEMLEAEARSADLSKDKCEIEGKAINLLIHHDVPAVEKHINLSLQNCRQLLDLDGKITDSNGKQPAIVVNDEHIPNPNGISFQQVGGLSQGEPVNFLCGHYALFFLLQAVEKKDFCDRNRFNELIVKWQQLLFKKRAIRWISNQPRIPYGLTQPTHSLTADDFQYLIKNCEDLRSLRETKGCILLELDTFIVNSIENFSSV